MLPEFGGTYPEFSESSCNCLNYLFIVSVLNVYSFGWSPKRSDITRSMPISTIIKKLKKIVCKIRFKIRESVALKDIIALQQRSSKNGTFN